MDTQSKGDDFIRLLFIVLSHLQTAFAMPATGRSILMNGTVNFSALDSWKSTLILCGVHHSLCIYGWKEATQKKSWLHSPQYIGTLMPFSYALRLAYPFSVFVRPLVFTQLFSDIDWEMSK
jgi:hypothetical protein